MSALKASAGLLTRDVTTSPLLQRNLKGLTNVSLNDFVSPAAVIYGGFTRLQIEHEDDPDQPDQPPLLAFIDPPGSFDIVSQGPQSSNVEDSFNGLFIDEARVFSWNHFVIPAGTTLLTDTLGVALFITRWASERGGPAKYRGYIWGVGEQRAFRAETSKNLGVARIDP